MTPKPCDHAGRILVDPGVLLSAFRYALGRATYIVGDTARELIAHRDALPQHWRDQIVRDIDLAIGGDRAGMDCDARQWARVADAMRDGEASDA